MYHVIPACPACQEGADEKVSGELVLYRTFVGASEIVFLGGRRVLQCDGVCSADKKRGISLKWPSLTGVSYLVSTLVLHAVATYMTYLSVRGVLPAGRCWRKLLGSRIPCSLYSVDGGVVFEQKREILKASCFAYLYGRRIRLVADMQSYCRKPQETCGAWCNLSSHIRPINAPFSVLARVDAGGRWLYIVVNLWCLHAVVWGHDGDDCVYVSRFPARLRRGSWRRTRKPRSSRREKLKSGGIPSRIG